MLFEVLLGKTFLKKEFSIHSLFYDVNMPDWLIYPLISFNVFELLYILFFSFFLSKISQSHLDANLRVVLLSYGGIFLLWIVFVLFLSID